MNIVYVVELIHTGLQIYFFLNFRGSTLILRREPYYLFCNNSSFQFEITVL